VSPFSKEGAGKFKRSQDEFALTICVFAPVGTHIGRAIIQDNIALLSLGLFSKLLIAGWSSDISLEAGSSWNFLNGVKINPDND
jgi:hypothetical protein